MTLTLIVLRTSSAIQSFSIGRRHVASRRVMNMRCHRWSGLGRTGERRCERSTGQPKNKEHGQDTANTLKTQHARTLADCRGRQHPLSQFDGTRGNRFQAN